MEQQPFYAALAHANEWYNISLQDSQFENIALHAWDHIGNKDYRLYTYHADIIDEKMVLPCNVDIIEGVFSPYVDYRMRDNRNRWDYTNYLVENFVRWSLRNREVFDSYGSFIPYEREGNTLYFKEAGHIHAHVLYKGVYVDDAGLPFLNFKEVDAIAKYIAWIDTQKKALMTKDKSTFEFAQMLHQQ